MRRILAITAAVALLLPAPTYAQDQGKDPFVSSQRARANDLPVPLIIFATVMAVVLVSAASGSD